MDFIKIAKQRFSVCSYTDQTVEKEKLDKILEAAHVTPMFYLHCVFAIKSVFF